MAAHFGVPSVTNLALKIGTSSLPPTVVWNRIAKMPEGALDLVVTVERAVSINVLPVASAGQEELMAEMRRLSEKFASTQVPYNETMSHSTLGKTRLFNLQALGAIHSCTSPGR